MNIEDLRTLDDKGLLLRRQDMVGELASLRFQHATGQLDNTAQLRTLRRSLARVNTVIRQREAEQARIIADQEVRQSSIDAERSVAQREIEKQRLIREQEIAKEQAVEAADVERHKQIALAEREHLAVRLVSDDGDRGQERGSDRASDSRLCNRIRGYFTLGFHLSNPPGMI